MNKKDYKCSKNFGAWMDKAHCRGCQEMKLRARLKRMVATFDREVAAAEDLGDWERAVDGFESKVRKLSGGA